MPKKAPSLMFNEAGGVDLLTERDSGNEIRILTGKKENSLDYWEELQKLCVIALDILNSSFDVRGESGGLKNEVNREGRSAKFPLI